LEVGTLRIIGEDLLARDNNGDLRTRIATIFPPARTIVTFPHSHAEQRLAFTEFLNATREEHGKPRLTESEEEFEMDQSVDLLVEEQGVIIRPDPSRMDLALAADELLQEKVPKRLVKYLYLSDLRVREMLKKRGECWRIFLPPSTTPEICRMIVEARTAIEGRAIYYYSPVSGTRFLTFETLAMLATLDDAELRGHLAEIAAYAGRRNHNGYCEIQLFMSDEGAETFDFAAAGDASDGQLRSRFDALCREIQKHVPPDFQKDDVDEPVWRNQMFTRLMTQRGDVIVDDPSMGLDSEFSMRVEWMPGGRIEEGELILDPAIEEIYGRHQEKRVSSVVRGLILNIVQEYGDLEYINLGSVLPSPKRNERRGGRREVYVAQIKQRRAAGEILQIIRMQKWGVRERLDEGKSLEEAMTEAEEYTEYVLDRRLACRQLGMNVPVSQTAHKVSEQYDNPASRYHGRRIWSPYFQRDYITGLPTDQIPARKLADPSYAISFALLFGHAAASNVIVGRAELSGEAVFDVGDEIVVENPAVLPSRIIVSDQVGTFVDWTGPLEAHAPEYAYAIKRRLPLVTDREQFISAFLSGFTERFIRIQDEYTKHRRAFDTLFKHRPWDPRGSPAYRWSSVLERLRKADARKLSQLISDKIRE
jgi:hypothetical protein